MPRPARPSVRVGSICALATAAAAAATVVTWSPGAASAAPTSVAIAGSFQSEVGCAGDWATSCGQTQLTRRSDGSGMWSTTVSIPSGSWAYKAALNDSWTENYGAKAGAGGADIALVVPAGGRNVTFVYDPITHWVTDDLNARIVTAAGDFQSELGCTADWAPNCLMPWLEDIDGDGTYTATTTAIPAGNWTVKATISQSWTENYGQNGSAGGADIAFTVPGNGSATTFSYNSTSHVLAVTGSSGAGTPSLTPTPTAPSGPTSPLDSLGAIYTPASTTFRIWSPDSSNVSVSVAGATRAMARTTLPGYTDVYQVVVPGDLKNQTYQFSVNGSAVRDPYAQMVKPGTTQGIVINDAEVMPSTGSWAPRPAQANREDAVVYELHVRDFTIDASSGVDPAKRGKFLGLVQSGTRVNGVSTGIDHLKELGVTDVQILPAFDFGQPAYDWGYDPVNYNVPEEQYSQFTAPEDRVREFKDMVDGLHRAGIRVIMDVVYNHTFSKDVLQGITGKYYTPNDLSGTGNSLDDGNPMVSRMIRDSLEHWVRNYNVDGFRFDLLGVHNYANAASWGSYLNTTYPDRGLLIYGEPWSGGVSDPQESQKVRYGTTSALADAHVGVFNGAYRDAIKGGTRDTVMNFMAGSGNASAVALGMRGSPLASKSKNPLSNPWEPAFAYDPEQTINYVSAHDDLSLWDKITYSGVSGGATGRAGQIDRFATGIVLTSQGVPFLTEGDEFLRTKVVNGDYGPAMNSYNSPDSVNAIHWDDKTNNATMVKYYRDLIALRKSTPSLRLTTWDQVNNQVSTRVDGSVVVSSISSNAGAPTSYDTVVVYNPTDSNYSVNLPAGSWTKVLDGSGAVRSTGNACGGLAVTVFTRS